MNTFTIKTTSTLVICLLIINTTFLRAQGISMFTSTGYTGAGNPASLNTETDGYTSGWTKINTSALTTNKWFSSDLISIPFDFYFYGEKVTQCVVSANGLLSFDVTSTYTTPANPSSTLTLPSTTLDRKKTIAWYWSTFVPKASNDFIYYKTFGSSTAHNRQLWIKTSSYGIGNKSNNLDVAVVLEETTNKIYFVELQGTTSSAAAAATAKTLCGTQYNTTYYSTAYTKTFAYPAVWPVKNTYYEMSPVNYSSLTLGNKDLSAFIPAYYFTISHPTCSYIAGTISQSLLKAQLDLGDDYKYSGYNYSVSVTYNLDVIKNKVSFNLATSAVMKIEQNTSSGIYDVMKVYNKDLLSFLTSKGLTITGTDTLKLTVIAYSITAPSGVSSFSTDVRLKLWYENTYSTKIKSVNFSMNPVTVTTNPVTFSVTPYSCGFKPLGYRFQLLKLSNTKKSYASDPKSVYAIVDWKNALDLFIENDTSIKLSLTEGKGYYIWRFMAVGDLYEGGVGNYKNWGTWVEPYSQDAVVDVTSSTVFRSPGVGIIYFDSFDDKINWAYSRTFTEGNQVHEKIDYADGIMRAKQSQVHLMNNDTIIATQTVYDYVGRPALSTLPLPVPGNHFDYREALVKDAVDMDVYTAKDYDSDDYGTIESPHLFYDASTEAMFYWSDENTNKNLSDAEGYGFARSIFHQDGLSRPKEVGMPGSMFSIGGKTSKNFISACSGDELVSLFGNEALADTTVLKNITSDGNGVLTVAYVNKDNQLIASCLSGNTNDKLDPIDGSSGIDNVVDEINSTSTVEENRKYKKEKTITLSSSTTVNVKYDLNPKVFNEECHDYCYTCDYQIDIYVIASSDEVLLNGTETEVHQTYTYNPSTCVDQAAFTSVEFDVNVTLSDALGNVTVGRTISVNNFYDETSQYLEYHLDNMSALVNQKFEDAKIWSDDVSISTVHSMLEKVKEAEVDTTTGEVYNLSDVYDFVLANFSTITSADIYGDEPKDTIALMEKSGGNCCEIKLPVQDCETDYLSLMTYVDTDGVSYQDPERFMNEYWDGVLTGPYAIESPYQYFMNSTDSVSLLPVNKEASFVLTFNLTSSATSETETDMYLALQYDDGGYFVFMNTTESCTTDATKTGVDGYWTEDMAIRTGVSNDEFAANVFNSIMGYFKTAYGASSKLYPFHIILSSNTITVTPNFNLGINDAGYFVWKTKGTYGTVNSLEGSTETTNTFTVSETSSVVGGNDMFNTLFTNTVEKGGYDIEQCAEAWYNVVGTVKDNIEGRNFVNLLEVWLSEIGVDDKANRKYISDHPYGTVDETTNLYYEYNYDFNPSLLRKAATVQGISISQLGNFGPGWFEYAYLAFELDTTPNFTESSTGGISYTLPKYDDTMYDVVFEHYGVTRDKTDITSTLSYTDLKEMIHYLNSIAAYYDLMVEDLSSPCTDPSSCDCKSAMIESYENICESVCELRAGEFRRRLIEEFAYTEGEALECAVAALVDHCKGDCDLSVTTDASSGECVVSGAEDFEKAMLYDFEILEPTTTSGTTNSSCLPEFEIIDAYIIKLSEVIVDELNAKISTGEITNQCYTVIEMKDLINNRFQEHLLDPSYDFSLHCDYLFTAKEGVIFITSNSEFVLDATTNILSIQNADMGAISSYSLCSRSTTTESYSYNLVQFDEDCEVTTTCGPFCFKWLAVDTISLNPEINLEVTSCDQVIASNILSYLDYQMNECVEYYSNYVENAYTDSCTLKESIDDELTASYSLGYHLYTLYYYDRVGNLIKTVPPSGVDLPADGETRTRSDIPDHTMVSKNSYNSFNLLVERSTPDAGTARNWYDYLGRPRFTQTAQQKIDLTYVYIKYDGLGRIIETGLSSESAADDAFALNVNDMSLPSTGTERRFTVYSSNATDRDGVTVTYLDGSQQEYLLNRISYAYTDKDGDLTTTSDQVRTYYSYDIAGNVEWFIQDIDATIGKLYMRYEYDLVSGKITKSLANEGRNDMIIHRYTYNADNALTLVETSTDGVIYEKDITYKYYAHGPLKRKEIGHDKLQGIDYTYTLQGWLKGINAPSLSSTDDPGKDGSNRFANDLFGMTLNYYAGDFKKTGSIYQSSSATANYKTPTTSLYNGMITGWTENSQKIPGLTDAQFMYNGVPTQQDYTYDLLYRLKASNMSTYK